MSFFLVQPHLGRFFFLRVLHTPLRGNTERGEEERRKQNQRKQRNPPSPSTLCLPTGEVRLSYIR